MAPDRPTLVYDGACGFCAQAAGLVRRWDRDRRLDVIPFQDEPQVARFGVSIAAYAAAMHLFLPDGRVFTGADALPALARLLPGKEWLGWPWVVPGVAVLARRAYAAVAAHRRCRAGSAVDAAAASSVGSPR